MRKLFPLLTLLTCTGFAAEQITLTITVTNHAETGDTLVINATTRTWTNAHSTSTILTNSATGPAPTATNLAYNLSLYSIVAGSYTVQTNTNTVRIIFPVGTTVAASESGNWATFVLYTQVVTRAWSVRVPMSIESSTNQTNFASMLVDGLRKATNSWTPGEMATTNFAALAGHNLWTGTNRFRDGWWTNATLVSMATASGTLGALTNGVLTNTILVSPVMSNAASYSGFRSPGIGLLSEQIGSAATATGAYSVAFGNAASANGANSGAFGFGASASADSDLALGAGAEAGYGSGVALGPGSAVNATNSSAIGAYSLVGVNHANSVALGARVITTETNQIMIGTNTHKVRVRGQFEPTGTITNATFTGTNAFGISGGPYASVLLRRYNNTTLADTNNHNISTGGSAYLKVSGPSTGFDITGIQSETGYDGYFLVLQNSTGFGMQIRHENGGSETTNRIYTGTAADFWVTNNPGSVTFIYDSAAARWVVLNHSN